MVLCGVMEHLCRQYLIAYQSPKHHHIRVEEAEGTDNLIRKMRKKKDERKEKRRRKYAGAVAKNLWRIKKSGGKS